MMKTSLLLLLISCCKAEPRGDPTESSIVFFTSYDCGGKNVNKAPTPEEIAIFEGVWMKSDKPFSAKWFYETCSWGKAKIDPSKHVIFPTVVNIPNCIGKSPFSKLNYDLTKQFGLLEMYTLPEFALVAWNAATSGDKKTFRGLYDKIIVSASEPMSVYGMGDIGPSPSYEYVWILRERFFPVPKIHTFIHEIAHTMGIMHSSSDTWEYGDVTDPMGTTDTSDICHNAVNSRRMGWSKPVADLSDANLPLDLWIPYSLPPYHKTPINHLTISSTGLGKIVVYLSMRSRVSGGFDSGLTGDLREKFDNKLSIHFVYGVGGYPYMLIYASDITPLVAVTGKHGATLANAHLAVAVDVLDKEAGAKVRICKFSTSAASCKSTESFAVMNTSTAFDAVSSGVRVVGGVFTTALASF